MAGICCGLVGESETAAAAPVEPASARAKRRSSCLELRPFKFVPPSDMADASDSSLRKRSRIDASRVSGDEEVCNESERPAEAAESSLPMKDAGDILNNKAEKFGMTSVCGRRRDMEDAVSIRTGFTRTGDSSFFGVFDGHGCSHVAMRCRDRLHEIVQEEMDRSTDEAVQWEDLMARSFTCMDRDVEEWTGTTASMARSGGKGSSCRCELQAQQCDAVGSTAVVSVVTTEKIIVSNCGDSRAVLCRKGVAISLSTDHKPDRPDELERIEAAGGRVIYWDGPRVLGVLAMSRAIGDNYLKPYVIPLPEVTVTERTEDDECLILASDGLWDVVTNETACRVAAMCLRAHRSRSKPESSSDSTVAGSVTGSDKACSDASILLTKLALARHSTDNVSVVVVDLRRNKAT